MKNAVDVLKAVSNEIFVKYFENNMIMIHSNNYSIENIYNQAIRGFFESSGSICFNLKDFCTIVKLKNQVLAKLLIDELVFKGYICVDESDIEITYFKNLF